MAPFPTKEGRGPASLVPRADGPLAHKDPFSAVALSPGHNHITVVSRMEEESERVFFVVKHGEIPTQGVPAFQEQWGGARVFVWDARQKECGIEPPARGRCCPPQPGWDPCILQVERRRPRPRGACLRSRLGSSRAGPPLAGVRVRVRSWPPAPGGREEDPDVPAPRDVQTGRRRSGREAPPLLPAPQTGTRPPSKAVAGGLRRANGLEELGGGKDAD